MLLSSCESALIIFVDVVSDWSFGIGTSAIGVKTRYAQNLSRRKVL
jgi:hypothetical protein